MTALRGVMGRPVLEHDSAEEIGTVSGFALDVRGGRMREIVVKSGRRNRLVDWSDVASIGPDAIIVAKGRDPSDDEADLVSGVSDPLGRRAVTDQGEDLGEVDDVEIRDDGSIDYVVVPGRQVEAARLRGLGSFALVVHAD